MRRTITTTTMALAMVAMLAVVAEGAPRPPRLRPEPPAMNTGGNFASVCRFSHRLPDDPIVAPGAPGASHSHDFFGNTTTDANSTYASLQAADTTCNREADTAAYWVPTLSSGGQQIHPLVVQAYYNARGKESVEPPPADLRIIAGDGRAQAPQPIAIVAWHCGERMREGLSQTPPACEDGRRLRLQIRFPDCWDGANLDSADHKSHMAYSRRATCPSTHPVPLAGLRLTVSYPISDGRGATLSSGGVLTGHADFFNAWDQDELARLTEFCLNGHHGCGRRG